MRRFLTLVSLLCLALPAGITLTGCTRNPAANYCNGSGYGAKITDVASITLQPQTTGISLAFGQTKQITTPTAATCKGDTASVSSYTYGTTNNKLVDISTSGMICAGTWNRNSGGGISDYTTCNKPDPLPSTNGLPYSAAYITATANSVTSNSVEVYVHAQATSVALVGSSQCYSQTATTTLTSQACYSGTDSSGSSTQYLFCKPTTVTDSSNYACPVASGVTTIPTCDAALGAFTYTVGTSTIASINADTNVITALLPGTTAITASVAGTGASAGYFSVCPVGTLALKTSTSGTSASITQGVQQTLTATATDTSATPATVTGLSLDYQSTNPVDISVSSGTITATYPGYASITAICQPSDCNPAPTNELGLYGTGLSIASNTVNITVPGTTSNYVWFAAPGKSQYFVDYDMLHSSLGTAVRMPYVPNSMAMDKTATTLYFGSTTGLMAYSTTTNSITTQNTSYPGVVLTVSPDDSDLLINDQSREIFYIYGVSGSAAVASQGGLGVAAAWTPDSKTLYIVDSTSANTTSSSDHKNMLYVYNSSTGWSSYALSYTTAQSLAITIPSVGAFLAGTETVAHSWCPTGTVGDTSDMVLYPPTLDTDPTTSTGGLNTATDIVSATVDGSHILGTKLNSGTVTLADIGVTIPTSVCPTTSTTSSTTTTQTLNGGEVTFGSTVKTTALSGVNPTAVNQIVASPVAAKNLAFITYTADSSNTSATLPYYLYTTQGTLGTLGYLSLDGSTSISAPVAGAFTPDGSYFVVSTAGDNKAHFLTIPSSVSTSNPPTDSLQVTPALPACSSTSTGCTYTGSDTTVPATVITVKPRATT
jgi:hypothetical protein